MVECGFYWAKRNYNTVWTIVEIANDPITEKQYVVYLGSDLEETSLELFFQLYQLGPGIPVPTVLQSI